MAGRITKVNQALTGSKGDFSAKETQKRVVTVSEEARLCLERTVYFFTQFHNYYVIYFTLLPVEFKVEIFM